MVFLLVMSLSFFIDNNKESLNHYNTKLDYFRAFCEIVTLLIAFVHLLSEFDQMEKYAVLHQTFSHGIYCSIRNKAVYLYENIKSVSVP